MIARFSAYGFLKNLRFFEAFLVLALRERGLSFTDIGLLIAIRELSVNICEVPSGAIADGFGRRRCMVLSMAMYLVSYLLLGFCSQWWLLALALLIYGVADAFRSGTHKALIYTWLRQQGREHERTRVYGFTRSWSLLGTALSTLLAGAALWVGLSYDALFILSIVPAALNLVNLATYPASLDPPVQPWRRALGAARTHFGASLRAVRQPGPLRRLMGGTLAMEGTHAVAKDYLPVLAVALSATHLPALIASQRAGLVMGIVGTVLGLGSAVLSRQAHHLEHAAHSPERAERWLLAACALAYAVYALSTFTHAALAFIALCFVALLQHIWRPIHIGRFDTAGDEAHAATTLSLEAQAKALFAAVLAPLFGYAIDHLHAVGTVTQPAHLWPLALLGLAPLLALIRSRSPGPATEP